MTTITRPADHDEWLAARRPYFNASAAAALFGEHPFLSLAAVVRSKLSPPSVDVENAAMRRGRHLEPAIAAWWAEQHHAELYEPEVMYAAGALLATLDRRIVGNDTAAVECKSTADVVTTPARSWWWQVQAQMACAELDVVHVAVLDATMRFASYRVRRDDDAIAALLERADAVMVHVNAGHWPPHVAGRTLTLPRRR